MTLGDPVSRVLQQAAHTIEEYGWHQGDYGDDATGFCALGAINKVVYGVGDADVRCATGSRLNWTEEQWDEYRDAIEPYNLLSNEAESRLHDVIDSYDVPGWNDFPDQSKDNVVQAFREAALL